MKTSYTEEALADIVSALTYLNERSPVAAVKLDADIEQCVDRARLPPSPSPDRTVTLAFSRRL